MANFELTNKDNVFILTMTNQDNTFTIDILNELNDLIDKIENHKGNTALLMTSNYEKTFSTGINLDWYLPQTLETKLEFKSLMEKVFARISLLDMPTIACVNGNAYAGGAILATGFDFKFMRADRGRYCFPEINVKIPFTDVLMEIVRVIPTPALEEMIFTGVAFGGKEALEKNIVQAIYPKEELFDKSFELAKMMAQKDRKTYKTTKLFYKKELNKLYKKYFG